MDESDNKIIKLGDTHTDAQNFRFEHPYEITINGCLVSDVIHRDNAYMIHIDISETDAQQTLSDFVTDIAHRVGLDKIININHIALDFDPTTVSMMVSEHELFKIIKDPHILENLYVDVLIEWDSFYIKNSNLDAALQLTELALCDSLESESHTDLLSYIHDTAPCIISRDQVSELYQICQTNISVSLTMKQ